MTKYKLWFYTLMGILGFILLLFDTTVGHDFKEHLVFLANNLDAIEGVLLIFISGYNLGRILRK